MQVENEYGYFGNDSAHLAWLRDTLRRLGVDSLLFTSDGTFDDLTIATGGLPDLLRTANFGSRAAERLAALRRFQPTGPLVCMEFWVGWFDAWRARTHATRPADEVAAELDALLSLPGTHAVLYLFQGGTNWGLTAGGNLADTFEPFVTSYDYDALLDEAGDVTPKFLACRDVIHRHLNVDRPKGVFPPSPKAAYGRVRLAEGRPAVGGPAAGRGVGHASADGAARPRPRVRRLPDRAAGDPPRAAAGPPRHARLVSRPPQRHHPGHLVSQRRAAAAGARLPHADGHAGDPGPQPGPAQLRSPHDRTQGPDRRRVRRPHPTRRARPVRLDLSPAAAVGVAAGPPSPPGPSPVPASTAARSPSPGAPADTFLVLPGFGLGCAFVNGFNVGRYWNVGPQMTLFVPAPMLRTGENEIVVFDAVGCADPTIEFQDRPELGRSGP